jgi:CHAD domain-containing protein
MVPVAMRCLFVTMRVSHMNKPAARDVVFRRRVRAFIRDLERIHDGDAVILHRTRVASRRLRELLPVVGLDRDGARDLAQRLKRVTRRLGIVRELDVLTLVIRELHGKAQYPPIALREVGAAVAATRAAARERLASKLPPAKLKRLARQLQRAGKSVESPTQRERHRVPGRKQAWLWALDARSVSRARTLQSTIQLTSVLYVPEQLHEVRIAVKKLRYAEELRAEARHRPSRDVAVLRVAQNLLGRLHDLEVLIARVRDVQSQLSASHQMAWHQLGVLVRTLEGDCRRLHGRYMRGRTKLVAIAARIAGRATEGADAHARAVI